MKTCLTSILLSASIILIAFGAHTDNFVLIGIGGFSVGVYNAIICKKD